MTIEYEPWEELTGVRVTTPHAREKFGVEVAFVDLPYVAGRDADACVVTAKFAADVALGHVMNAMLEKEREQSKQAEAMAFSHMTFEGPLVRFVCHECGNSKDAWVDDNGRLEDSRHAFCYNENCARHGRLMQPEEES